MKISGVRINTFILMLLFFAMLNGQKIYGQNFIPESTPSNIYAYNLYPFSIYPHAIVDTTIEENSPEGDTLVQEEKPKLLPDKISFGEKIFWGESGVFRGLGIASPLTPEVRKRELTVRRAMLTMHQIGGFLALASMIGTAWTGQRTIDDPQNRALRNDHQKFILSTIITYSLTASLSILSPPPLIRRDDGGGTTSIHKTLAWFHVAGMILTPIIGSMVSTRGKSGPSSTGSGIDINKARFHQYAGYITTAIFAASMIVITF
jgi:hypothetical protein